MLVAVTAALALAASTHAGVNGWTTGGPEGGVIYALAIDPQIAGVVYAGALLGGLFKSSTGGSIWIPAENGLTSTRIFAAAVDPQTPTTLYVSTGAGVFKSTNGGQIWNASTLGITGDAPSALVVDPVTSATLYAGSFSGVFKSTNGGSSWSLTSLNRFTASLVVDPLTPRRSRTCSRCSTLYAGVVDGQGVGVFKSTDSGSSWSPTSLAQGAPVLAIDPQTPTTIYAGTIASVFKSTNGGASWSPSNSGLPGPGFLGSIRSLAIDPGTPSTVYAGTQVGVFKSTNGGALWSPSNSGIGPSIISALAVDPQGPATLYAGTFHGVFKSLDGGATWSPVNAAIRLNEISGLAIDPRVPATLYAGAGGALFKSDTGGASWRSSNAGLALLRPTAVAIDPQTTSTLYAGGNGNEIFGSHVFKSTDGGASWTDTGYPGTSGCSGTPGALAIDPERPTILYVGSGCGVQKSTDAGITWSLQTSGLPPFPVSNFAALAIDPRTPATLYAGTDSGVFKTTNGGASWILSSSGLTTLAIRALAIDPQQTTTVYAATFGGGVFKSGNGGASWNPSIDGLTNLNVKTLAIAAQRPATLYASTVGGVFRSSNGAASWAPVNVGLKNLDVAALAIDPAGTCVHAGIVGDGVFTFATRIDASCLPPPPLVAALSTTSQSVEVGTDARTFATVENRSGTSSGVPTAADDGVTAVSCGITQLTGAPTPFTFQAVDPATNQPVAPLNTPVDIAPATARKFVVTLTASASFCPTDIQFGFNCTNSGLADILTGQNTLLLSAGATAGCGLRASVSTNQASFVAGQTLIAGGSVTNPGLPGLAADFYVGVLRPGGSIQFVTPTGIVVGTVSDLRSFRPLAVNVPLAMPFSESQSSLFTHQWTADELRGSYVFFLLAVKSGALSGGPITDDQILKIATAPYAFP